MPALGSCPRGSDGLSPPETPAPGACPRSPGGLDPPWPAPHAGPMPARPGWAAPSGRPRPRHLVRVRGRLPRHPR
eukprot:7083456-Prymnesium_polylepis.1